MRVVAVDWSGRRTGERDAIWLAEACDDVVTRLECGRSRAELVEHLIALARDDPELAVGFDFSFSFPAWFLAGQGWASADELWDEAAEHGEAWLAACAPPFWGRPGRGRPPMPSSLRVTEAELGTVGGTRAKSTFQIGGVGSVGTGSVRGFPALARLRRAGFRIWPFHDTPRAPVVVEVYPRVFTGAVVKSRADARRAHVDAHVHDVDDRIRTSATSSEDAFDALFTALGMSRAAGELAALPKVIDRTALVEGRVWTPVQGAEPPADADVPPRRSRDNETISA